MTRTPPLMPEWEQDWNGDDSPPPQWLLGLLEQLHDEVRDYPEVAYAVRGLQALDRYEMEVLLGAMVKVFELLPPEEVVRQLEGWSPDPQSSSPLLDCLGLGLNCRRSEEGRLPETGPGLPLDSG